MFCIADKIKGMSDETLGQWFRKAVIDLCSGCIANDVDAVVEESFNRSKKHMLKVQKKQANKYQNRKFKEDASIREDEENYHSAVASSGNGDEAATRKAADESHHPSCATFEDAPHREAGENLQHVGTTTAHADLESPTSSTPLHGTGHNTSTHPLPLGDTTAPCNNSADCSNDQVTRQQSASPAEAPLSASPDSGNGNVPDETAKSSFVAIVDDRSCKSGKSGDVAQAKRPYGEFGHVMLTEREGNELRKLYGNDLKLAIDILDSYIENGGKAAKKYKRHYLVMRKGNWVWQKVQNTKLTEKRLENASNSSRSFRERERERMAETAGSLLTDKDREDFGLPATIYDGGLNGHPENSQHARLQAPQGGHLHALEDGVHQIQAANPGKGAIGIRNQGD